MVRSRRRSARTIDESAFANAESLATLEQRRAGSRSSTTEEAAETVDFPSWNRSWPARVLRRLSLATWILPLARLFAWIKVDGLEHLEHIDGPVVFAANHQSHMDAPAILWALPARWRVSRRHRDGEGVLQGALLPGASTGAAPGSTNSLNYYLAALFFNAFPLPQREAGARQTLRYIGELHHGRLVGADLPGGQAQR